MTMVLLVLWKVGFVSDKFKDHNIIANNSF